MLNIIIHDKERTKVIRHTFILFYLADTLHRDAERIMTKFLDVHDFLNKLKFKGGRFIRVPHIDSVNPTKYILLYKHMLNSKDFVYLIHLVILY